MNPKAMSVTTTNDRTTTHNATSTTTRREAAICQTQFGTNTTTVQGTSIMACLGGQCTNSTRAELLGAIVATGCDHPAHIGIDNAACVSAGQQLIAVAKQLDGHVQLETPRVYQALKDICKGKLRKPWSLQPNGDLLKLLLAFIISKGPHAVLYTKIKGHAKQTDIDKGITTVAKAAGNKKSDEVAELGVQLFGESLVLLAKWFKLKHELLCRLMSGLHAIIVGMFHDNRQHQLDKYLANNPFAKAKKPTAKVHIPLKLTYGVRQGARPLRFRPLPTGRHQFKAQQHTLDTIRDFLSFFKWDYVAVSLGSNSTLHSSYAVSQ